MTLDRPLRLDFIDDDLQAVDAAFAAGVRLIAPVHYSPNSLGSISMGWRGRVITPEEQTGLTAKGRRFVEKANALGLIIDLAHADDKTIIDAARQSKAPLICSHSGPRALTGFLRHVEDDAITAIAATGGLIGLWPFLHRGDGTIDTESFKQQARYLRQLVGADHMAIGTDFNGVPGYMKGYRDITESAVLLTLLAEAGFSDSEIKGVAGANFLRVFTNQNPRAGC